MVVQLATEFPEDKEPIITQYIVVPTTRSGWVFYWLWVVFVTAFFILPVLVWSNFRFRIWPKLVRGLQRAILED